MAEMAPAPRDSERVLFVPFILRGMSLPIHRFLHGFLYFYGFQLHHVVPNSILHITCFVMLCERFSGARPHFDVWRRYFRIKL